MPGPGGRGRVACASEARLSRLGTCARKARAPGRGCAQRVRRTARRHPSVPSPLEALSSPQTRRPTPRVGPAARRGAGGCPCRSGHSVPSGSHGGEPGAGGSRRAARLLCSFHRRRQFYRLAGDRTLAGLTALIQRAAGPGPHRKAPSELWGGRKAGPHAAGLRSGPGSRLHGGRLVLSREGPAPDSRSRALPLDTFCGVIFRTHQLETLCL